MNFGLPEATQDSKETSKESFSCGGGWDLSLPHKPRGPLLPGPGDAAEALGDYGRSMDPLATPNPEAPAVADCASSAWPGWQGRMGAVSPARGAGPARAAAAYGRCASCSNYSNPKEGGEGREGARVAPTPPTPRAPRTRRTGTSCLPPWTDQDLGSWDPREV